MPETGRVQLSATGLKALLVIDLALWGYDRVPGVSTHDLDWLAWRVDQFVSDITRVWELKHQQQGS